MPRKQARYGQPAVYNSTPPTLTDGDDSALNVNSSGALLTASGGSGTTADQVQGTAADNAASVGNPVKVGGRYESGTDTYADGDVGDLHIDVNGNLLVNPGALSSATDSVTAVTNSETTTGSALPAKGQLIAGSDGTNARNIATSTGGRLHLAAASASNGAIPTESILLGHRGADENIRALKGNDQGDGQSTGILAAGTWAFNGTNSDKVRNNVEATVLASAARTATANGTDQTNYNGRGVMLILNVTANPGAAETLSLKLQAKDSISGSYLDVADAGVLFTAANGTKALVVHPGILAADFVSGTVGKSAVVPRTWRAVVTHSSTGSWTYSVSAVTLTA